MLSWIWVDLRTKDGEPLNHDNFTGVREKHRVLYVGTNRDRGGGCHGDGCYIEYLKIAVKICTVEIVGYAFIFIYGLLRYIIFELE